MWWWGDGTGLDRWSLLLTNWKGTETLCVSSTTLSFMGHLPVLPPRSTVTPPPHGTKMLKQDSAMPLLNPATESSQHPLQGCLPIAYLTSELPGEVLGLTFAIQINFQPLPWPGTLLAPAHHMLCLAGCTYTGRIFYNNETFPSVLDPCLSCICLVCTTQPDPNPQHQLLKSRQGVTPGPDGNHLPATCLPAACLAGFFSQDQGII